MDEEQAVKEMVLATVSRCVVCGHHYGVENIEIVGRQEECWFFSMVCDECRTQGLVAALVGGNGPVEIVTDAEIGMERLDMRLPEPITSDDVLDMYEFLVKFNGDFRSLFARNVR